MGAAAVIEINPVANDAAGVLLGFEAVAVRALLLECSDDALDHAVLLRAVRGDELLLQAVAADQAREVAAGKNEPIACWE